MLASGLWKANAKATLPWDEVLFRGIGCNWLVCPAAWMALWTGAARRSRRADT